MRHMNRTRLAFIPIILTILAAFQLQAAVKVTDAENKETPVTENKEKPAADNPARTVALRLVDGNFVTASPSGTLDLTGKKIGSKQTFAIIDVNGGELADGDEVKIRYTPNKDGVSDPSKASYWQEGKGGIVRKREGGVFKMKKVDTKYAFQTPGGKFVTGTVTDGALGLSDKQESALLVELVDVQPRASTPKAPASPAVK